MEPVSKNAQKRRVKAEKAALKKAEKAARAAAAARSACASTADAAAAAADGDSVAHLLDSEPLSGADKWLGGVLGSDGCVYGVPGHARSVLRIDPTTDTVQTVRGEDEALLEGRYKWLRGNLHPDGSIYCIPCHADRVLRIDCSSDPPALSLVGDRHPGEWKWHGAVLSPHDKCIYAIPQFAEAVLRLDPAAGTTSLLGGPFPGASPTGRHKWYGGLLGGDGCIYGIPQCATSVLKINPWTQQVSTLGALPPGGWKWHGGVVGADGCIYGIPAHADEVLKIDPFSQSVSLIPFSYRCHHRTDRKYKYLGGVLGPDGRIYCIPSDADHVLRIDPATASAVEVGPEISARAEHCHVNLNCNKWQNGFLAPDGLIYAIPLKASAVLRVDPMRDAVDVVGGPFFGFEKWEGGVLSRGGAMYCVPLNSKRVLKICPRGGGVARACDEDAQLEEEEEEEEAAPPDALLRHLCAGSEFGAAAREALQRDGYMVLRGVLSREECDAEVELLWRFVTTVSPAVVRDDPESWYPPADGQPDPWPHSGWRSFADMFQHHGAGWLFGSLRERLAERVFSRLFGTTALHASKEGFTFRRPTASPAGRAHPAAGRPPPNVCGRPQPRSCGEHFDQGAAEAGLQFVQSATALTDQAAEDACFQCWPGSHALHPALVGGTWRGRSQWVPLTDADLAALRAAGLSPRRVPVSRGDVILWRSDLAHAAAPPAAECRTFRAVAYASMRPASMTPRRVARLKVEAYQTAATGDHNPSREHWHAPPAAASDGTPRFAHFFADGPPKLTARQAELCGLVAYEGVTKGVGPAVNRDTPT
uniref:Uncharacterized protein n=1 Tax=Emiliania huxleyi TaxID=2903 RepID=A0A7S3WHZ1_EMIHU